MSTRPLALCAVLALLLFSCPSTKTTVKSRWKSPTRSTTGIDKVMVLGVTDNADRRRLFEWQFTSALRKHGVNAEPAYNSLPPGRKYERQEIVAALSKGGYDAILVTTLANIDIQTRTTVNPAATYAGTDTLARYFYGNYNTAYDNLHQAGYITEQTTYTLETNLYVVEGEELIWSATSDIVNADSDSVAVQSFAEAVTRSMARDRLF